MTVSMTPTSMSPMQALNSSKSSTSALSGKVDKLTKASTSESISKEEREQVTKLAQDFESIFLDLVFKTMRESVPDEGGMMDTSNGEKIFRSMLDGEYSKMMATQSKTGISDMISRDLLQTMEMQRSGNSQAAALKAYKDK